MSEKKSSRSRPNIKGMQLLLSDCNLNESLCLNAIGNNIQDPERKSNKRQR